MKNDKLVPGLILVMIGTIFLLDNFGYINFHWGNIFHLWPIILVICGVNLVFANNTSPWATILKITVVVAGFALLVFGNFSNRLRWWPHYTYHYNDDNTDNDNSNDDDSDNNSRKNGIVKVEGNSVFNEPYTPVARVARLNIDGGATTYTLNDTTSQLFSADTHEFFGKYQLNHHQEDSLYVVDFTMKDHNHTHFSWGDNDKDKSNSAAIKLNVNPEWEIIINTGATEVNFDLSKFKIRKLEVNGGASSFNLKLGQPLAVTNINISAGMAGANVDIPKDAACRITSSSAFSSNDFPGFINKNDGSYETEGFSTAKNKIYIQIKGAFSGFEVKRY